MVFSSVIFLFIFLAVFLFSYQIVSDKYKNYLILLASLFFYSWGAPKFVFILILSLIINFYIVKKLYSVNSKRNLYLIASLLINLGLLAYFKYANFFIDNVNFFFSTFHYNSISWVKVILPIGISFFTFQSLTYTIDVYRKVHAPLLKLTDYLLYILMFPQLIAGPIVRFNSIADDIIDRRKNETIDNKLLGLYRFVIGLSKKILIANILGQQVDRIYSLPLAEVDTSLAWIAVISYSFQIYYDFSGYSDMAIGLGKMIGFNFPENFNNPYVSKSITEFWRRWHITLGAWMKDYLYIPLGGSKVKSKSRLYFNLIVVFLLSGLWHGASWNFVIWGAWHGSFLILDKIFFLKFLERIGKIPSIILTFLIVLIGWVLFRIEDFGISLFYLKKMFCFSYSKLSISFDSEFWTILILAFIFSFITVSSLGKKLEKKIFYSNFSTIGHISMFLISCLFIFICFAYITSFGFNPFIYFRF